MRRRRFLAAAGALGLGAVASACADDGGQDEKSLQFFNDAASWGPGYVAAGKVLQQRMGWAISPQTIPNASSYEQVIRSLLQTHKPPDLVKWGSGYRTQDLARTGDLADVTSAWEHAVDKGWLDDSLREEFSYDGRVYGMPLIQGYYVMFYNAQVWKELDLTEPTTWDEFMRVCDTLKEAGITPIGTTQANIWPVANWFSMLAAAYDTEWYEALCANEASFLDPQAKDLFELWADMIDAGYHTSADAVGDDFPSMLKNKKIGMQPTPVSWSTESMENAGLDSDGGYGAFIMPSIRSEDRTVVTEIAGLIAPENSRHRDRTLEALTDWMDPEVQKPWSDFLNGSSANPKVPWSDPISQRLQKAIRDDGVTVVNRYWENSPPPLVVGVTQDLGGFMAGPGDVPALQKSLQQKADSEWSYWKEATR